MPYRKTNATRSKTQTKFKVVGVLVAIDKGRHAGRNARIVRVVNHSWYALELTGDLFGNVAPVVLHSKFFHVV